LVRDANGLDAKEKRDVGKIKKTPPARRGMEGITQPKLGQCGFAKWWRDIWAILCSKVKISGQVDFNQV
jgi:hypothetical protein